MQYIFEISPWDFSQVLVRRIVTGYMTKKGNNGEKSFPDVWIKRMVLIFYLVSDKKFLYSYTIYAKNIPGYSLHKDLICWYKR